MKSLVMIWNLLLLNDFVLRNVCKAGTDMLCSCCRMLVCLAHVHMLQVCCLQGLVGKLQCACCKSWLALRHDIHYCKSRLLQVGCS